MKKFFFAFVAICLIAVESMAQTTVKGVLMDKTLGESEPYATVRIFSAKKKDKPVAMFLTNENGQFQEIQRRHYNYFESDKMGAGPFTFRITDIYGQVIIDEGIPLSTDDTEIIQGHVQFPE